MKVVEEPCSLAGKGFGYFDKGFDPRIHGVTTPRFKELSAFFDVRLFPEESQLFFDRMHEEQRLVDCKKLPKPDPVIIVQRVVVSQKKKRLQAVKDHIYLREHLRDSMVVSAAHVHGNCFEAFSFLRKGVIASFLSPSTAWRVLPVLRPACRQTGRQRWSCNADVADFMKRHKAIKLSEPGAMNLLDQIPANAQVVCHRSDGAKTE